MFSVPVAGKEEVFWMVSLVMPAMAVVTSAVLA